MMTIAILIPIFMSVAWVSEFLDLYNNMEENPHEFFVKGKGGKGKFVFCSAFLRTKN